MNDQPPHERHKPHNPHKPHGQHPHQHHDRNRFRNRFRHNRPGGGGGQPPRETLHRTDAEKEFLGRTPLTPNEWIRLEAGSSTPSMRIVDLLSPIGKGTRGLIVAPPKSGKTTILKDLCIAVAKADPNIKVYCLLVDERPEEVTDFKRSVTAEVHASSSDRGYDEHMKLADLVYHKAIADAVAGKDAMIVVDSLTRLSRVHNSAATGNKTMSGGLDSRAMEVPRRFFGAARKLEEGGSLTILATILVDTGSRMDEVIFQEFKGTGNMELVLSRQASEARIFPAIHVKNSGTRREELLFPPDVLQSVWKLRRMLAGMSDMEATKTVVELVRKFPKNQGVLASISGI